MNISLPWGESSLNLNLPDSWQVIFPEPLKNTDPEISKNKTDPVKTSLKNPFDSEPLGKLKLKGKKIVIVVDDNTRPTPTDSFFHLILDSLEKGGASLKNVLLIPALGIHTPMTEEEMKQKVGAANLKKIRWENHDAFNIENNHLFGTTSRGTPARLNRHLADADLIISLGMVEPHLWAGFGGGLKNLLPGVAYYETIGIHHTIIAEPPYLFNRVGMEPESNSFRLDIEEIRKMIKAEIFCVNVVIDHKKNITASFAGDPVTCHRKAVEYNISVSGRHIEDTFDAAIVNSFPMDMNFKQSMKGVGNSLPAVRPGGAVIGFLKAERGLDDIVLPEKGKPLKLVKTILRLLGPSRVLGFLDKIRKGLNVEERFLLYYSMQLMRQHDLYFHVPTLSEDEVKRLGFFIMSHDPQETIDIAAKKIPRKARVAVFPEAGATFPVIRKK